MFTIIKYINLNIVNTMELEESLVKKEGKRGQGKRRGTEK